MESFGRRITLDLPFERALSETLSALAAAQVDVVGLLDVTKYLASRLHHDFRRYTLVQTMSAQATFEALHRNLGIGAILPTTVAVFELADGETAVVVAEPFGGLASHADWRRAFPSLAATADQTCDQLALALSHLPQRHPVAQPGQLAQAES